MTDVAGDAVRDYYASFDRRELRRLLTPEGRLEFAVTTRLLLPHLPAGGRILDIGGGPGRYAIWLAERGLAVTLADLSPNLLDLARELIAETGTRRVDEMVPADVRDLSRWPDATFAGTLALGPFYHLPDAGDRERALREIVRVTVPGGLVAIALMPRWPLLRRTLAVADERARLADPTFTEALLTRGEFTNQHPGRFTSAYGVDPSEVATTFAEAGLRPILLASTHGFATGLEAALDELRTSDAAAYDTALDLLIRTATDPGLLGTAGHLLYVGRTPEAADDPFRDEDLVGLYDLDNPSGPDHDYYRALADELGARQIVDLGCGTGLLTRTLAGPGRTVTGVDPSRTMLGHARRQPGSEAVNWVLGDASALAPTGTVDLVICTGNAIMQIGPGRLPSTLLSVAAALRPGGTFAFESRNPAVREWESWTPAATRGERDTPMGFLREWLEVTEAGDGRVVLDAHNVFPDGRDRVYTNTLFFRTAREFRAALASAGFTDVRVAGDWRGSPPTDRSRLLVVRARLAPVR